MVSPDSEPLRNAGPQTNPVSWAHDQADSTPRDASPDSPSSSRITDRREGSRDLRCRPSRDADRTATETPEDNDEQGVELLPESPERIEQLAVMVAAKLETHLHLPIQIPEAGALERLRTSAPEAYELYLDQIRKEAEHNRWVERAPYEQPASITRRGQLLGSLVVLAVLGVAAFALSLDRPWVAGVLAALDVVALAAVFMGTQGRE